MKFNREDPAATSWRSAVGTHPLRRPPGVASVSVTEGAVRRAGPESRGGIPVFEKPVRRRTVFCQDGEVVSEGRPSRSRDVFATHPGPGPIRRAGAGPRSGRGRGRNPGERTGRNALFPPPPLGPAPRQGGTARASGGIKPVQFSRYTSRKPTGKKSLRLP